MSTVVAFHAHPDDEVLLTGGTLASAAAAGHRVVLVTATRGEAGLTAAGTQRLGDIREAELRRSAAALGIDEVVVLGHEDSGMSAENCHGFAHQPVDRLGDELLGLLDRYGADVLLGYDRNGGYGHPDHRQVHRVSRYAAERTPSIRLLEATVDRAALQRVVNLVARLPFVTESWDRDSLRSAFAAPEDIDYRVDVRPHVRAKQAAMAAHRSQLVGGTGDRTLAVLSRLPRPIFRAVLGTEWFTDPGRQGGPWPLAIRNPAPA